MNQCKLNTTCNIENLSISEIKECLKACGRCYHNVYCDGYRTLHQVEEKKLFENKEVA